MSAIPDPFDLSAIADRIAGHAAAARERAGRLERALAAVSWAGFAADAFFEQAHTAAGALRCAAARLDAAADALRAHAARISELMADAVRLGTHELELMDDAAHLRPGDVLSDVGSILGDGMHLVGDVVPW